MPTTPTLTGLNGKTVDQATLSKAYAAGSDAQKKLVDATLGTTGGQLRPGQTFVGPGNPSKTPASPAPQNLSDAKTTGILKSNTTVGGVTQSAFGEQTVGVVQGPKQGVGTPNAMPNVQRNFTQVVTGYDAKGNPVLGNSASEVAKANAADAGLNPNAVAGQGNAAPVTSAKTEQEQLVESDPVIKQLDEENKRLQKQRDDLTKQMDASTASGLSQAKTSAIDAQYQQVLDNLKRNEELRASRADTARSEGLRQYDVAIENAQRVADQNAAAAERIAALTGAGYSAQGVRGLSEVLSEGQRAVSDLQSRKANYLQSFQDQQDQAAQDYAQNVQAALGSYHATVKSAYNDMIAQINAIDDKADKNAQDKAKEKKQVIADYLKQQDDAAKNAREDAKFNLDVLKYRSDETHKAHSELMDQFDKSLKDIGSGVTNFSASDLLQATGMGNDPLALARVQAVQAKSVQDVLEKNGMDTPEILDSVSKGIAAGQSPSQALSGALKKAGITLPQGSEDVVEAAKSAVQDTKPGRECTTYARQQFQAAGFPPILNEGLKTPQDDTLSFKMGKVNQTVDDFMADPKAGVAVLLNYGNAKDGTNYGHWGIITGQTEDGKLLMTSSNLGSDHRVSTVPLDPNSQAIVGFVDPSLYVSQNQANAGGKTLDESKIADVRALVDEYDAKGEFKGKNPGVKRKGEIEVKDLRRYGFTSITQARKAVQAAAAGENEDAIRYALSLEGKDLDSMSPEGRSKIASSDPDQVTAMLSVVKGDQPFSSVVQKDNRTAMSALGRVLSKELFGKSFTEQDWNEANKALTAFNSAQNTQNVTAFNTAIQHAANLKQEIAKAPNGSIPAFNKWFNDLRAGLGYGQPIDLTTNVETLASEIAKVYKGNASPTDSDKEEARSLISSNFSPEQVNHFVDKAAAMMSERLASMGDSYFQKTGRYPKGLYTEDAADAARVIGNPKLLRSIAKTVGYDHFLTPEEKKVVTANAPIVVYKDGSSEETSPAEISSAISEGMANAKTLQDRSALRQEVVAFLKDNADKLEKEGVDVVGFAEALQMHPQDLINELQ